MARDPQAILQDLIDRLEDLSLEARERVRAYVLTSIDLARLADPADVEYDRHVASAIMAILDNALVEAYRAGRDGVDQLFGIGTGASADADGPLLSGVRARMVTEINEDVGRLGLDIDRYLSRALARGMSPAAVIDALDADLAALGPRVFGDFATALDRTIETVVRDSETQGTVEQTVRQTEPGIADAEIERAAQSQPFMWVAALHNTCPDCLPRHGQIRSYSDWAAAGLPEAAGDWSVVHGGKSHPPCYCGLRPAVVLDRPEIMDPLRRARVEDLRALNARGISVRWPTGLERPEPLDIRRRQDRILSLRSQYEGDIEVRRAFRIAGRANAGAGE